MKKSGGMKSPSILIGLPVVCCLLLPGIAVSQNSPQLNREAGAQGKLVVDMSTDELRQYYPSELSDLVFDSN
jgi:hypothetical protein